MRTLSFIFVILASARALPQSDTDASCRQKWTYSGAGLNQRMFKNCVEERRAAWTKLDEVKKNFAGQPWFERFVATGCVTRWTTQAVVQPEMVAHCYQQEQDAFEDLRLGRKGASFNAGGAEACFKVWRTNPGQVFAKTLECYRKHGEVPNFSLAPELQTLLEPNSTSSPVAENP